MPRFNSIYLFTFCTCFAREAPLVTIPDQGMVAGREIVRSRIQRINGYLGIPYAAPPLNQFRFAPPVTDPMPPWDGILNATEFRPSCLQTKADYRIEAIPFLEIFSNLSMPTDEDCLYLNVFTPSGPSPSDGYAVVIWFHPGNFTTGHPSIWNPHTLVYRHRIIVVTMAWRLNIMGFLTTMDGEAPGNYGLMDQQAAMMWVNKNIQLFGGNPNNVALMGYGTGGVSVGFHMINQVSREYFHKVIIMSANFLTPSVVKYPQEDKEFLNRLADSFGCERKPTSRFMNCLRNVDHAPLVEFSSAINWRPVIDVMITNSTPFLNELPKTSFDRGDYHKVPVLTGYTDMEEVLGIPNLETLPSEITKEYLKETLQEVVSSDIPVNNNTDSCSFNHDHIYDAVNFFYGPANNIKDQKHFLKLVADFSTERYYGSATFLQATYFAKDQPTYVYRCDMKPITERVISNIPDWASVPHLFDLIYVWGMPYWEFEDFTWELRDKRISDVIMSFWVNFIKSSDPMTNLLYPVKWDKFSENNEILIINAAFNMSTGTTLNYKAFEFWNDYYPKVLSIATQCCNATDSAPKTYSLQQSVPFLIVGQVSLILGLSSIVY